MKTTAWKLWPNICKVASYMY